MLLFDYMEPQQNEFESVIAPLKKVTPLSKYLAMVLFVLLPFIGGYIGYTFALEKVVEVERVTNVNSNNGIDQSVGSEITNMTTPSDTNNSFLESATQKPIIIENIDTSKPYRSTNNFTISVPKNTSVSESQQTADSSGISIFSGDFGELCISTGYGCGGVGLQGWVSSNKVVTTESGIELTFSVWQREEGGSNQVLMVMTSASPISAIPTSEWQLQIDTTEEQLAVVETMIGSLKFEI